MWGRAGGREPVPSVATGKRSSERCRCSAVAGFSGFKGSSGLNRSIRWDRGRENLGQWARDGFRTVGAARQVRFVLEQGMWRPRACGPGEQMWLDDPVTVRPELADLVDQTLRRLPWAVLEGGVIDREDLRQEALLAVHAAAASFDPSRGVPFTAYARSCAKRAVAGVLRGEDRLPETVRRDLSLILAAEEQLTATLMRRPSDEQVAAACGLTTARVLGVRWWQDRGRHHVTDELAWEGLEDPVGSPEQEVIAQVEARAVRWGLARLPERSRRIVWARIVDEEDLGVVAVREGVSRARVSQITTDALRRLGASVALLD
jgi:RNA polymerase sigma factor (sigma-70 family)